ncbi:TPA: DNA-binding protein [Escherichia coli]|nr:DNA-binding protein [Escherichia coli]HCR5810335.1 DNA-binding protein [Shigella flexneri]EFG2312985.1 DNA-binding protein [Escherichia coli]EFO4330284.1 DNA-binding protein [Escherichia coli]EGK9458242.1 DNA-binding protein [Escherichia coli]EHI0493712.1 DNA-binding protein [Escherichia coli]
MMPKDTDYIKRNFLPAPDAVKYMGISETRFYELRRYIPDFPKTQPDLVEWEGSRRRRVYLKADLDRFMERFLPKQGAKNEKE